MKEAVVDPTNLYYSPPQGSKGGQLFSTIQSVELDITSSTAASRCRRGTPPFATTWTVAARRSRPSSPRLRRTDEHSAQVHAPWRREDAVRQATRRVHAAIPRPCRCV